MPLDILRRRADEPPEARERTFHQRVVADVLRQQQPDVAIHDRDFRHDGRMQRLERVDRRREHVHAEHDGCGDFQRPDRLVVHRRDRFLDAVDFPDHVTDLREIQMTGVGPRQAAGRAIQQACAEAILDAHHEARGRRIGDVQLGGSAREAAQFGHQIIVSVGVRQLLFIGFYPAIFEFERFFLTNYYYEMQG